MTAGNTLSRLAKDGRPYYPRLAVALVLGAVGGLTTLVAPWCLGQIVNRVIAAKHPDVHVLYVMLLAIFGALMLGAVATYGQTYLMAWSGQHLIAKMRALLFERVLRLPLGEFARWRPGELISRFSSDLADHDRCGNDLAAAVAHEQRDVRGIVHRHGQASTGS